jgi:hypothetical protein
MFDKFYIEKSFFKVSDKYIVSLISKIGCSTVAIQSHSYNCNEDINKYKHLEYENLWGHWNDDFIYKFNIDYTKLHNYPEQKVVVIFRDPIDRYMSIWGTSVFNHLNNNDFNDNLLKVKEHFDNNIWLNHHYCPQYMFYDFDKIDIFVELKDYPKFCEEHNIPWIMINKNNKPEYKKLVPTEEQKQIIKDIYNEDYILLDKIRNSNKLYIPKQ